MLYTTQNRLWQRINRSRSPGAGCGAGEHEELGHTGYVPFLNASDHADQT